MMSLVVVLALLGSSLAQQIIIDFDDATNPITADGTDEIDNYYNGGNTLNGAGPGPICEIIEIGQSPGNTWTVAPGASAPQFTTKHYGQFAPINVPDGTPTAGSVLCLRLVNSNSIRSGTPLTVDYRFTTTCEGGGTMTVKTHTGIGCTGTFAQDIDTFGSPTGGIVGGSLSVNPNGGEFSIAFIADFNNGFSGSCTGSSWIDNLFIPVTNGLGGVHGDPHFIGFLGQKYDVDGEAGDVINVISTRDIQVNARLVKDRALTHMGEVGFMLNDHDVEHRVLLSMWNEDGEEMLADGSWRIVIDGDSSVLSDIHEDVPFHSGDLSVLITPPTGTASASAYIALGPLQFKVVMRERDMTGSPWKRLDIASFIVSDDVTVLDRMHGVLGCTAHRGNVETADDTEFIPEHSDVLSLNGEDLTEWFKTNYQLYLIKEENNDIFGTDFPMNLFARSL